MSLSYVNGIVTSQYKERFRTLYDLLFSYNVALFCFDCVIIKYSFGQPHKELFQFSFLYVIEVYQAFFHANILVLRSCPWSKEEFYKSLSEFFYNLEFIPGAKIRRKSRSLVVFSVVRFVVQLVSLAQTDRAFLLVFTASVVTSRLA